MKYDFKCVLSFAEPKTAILGGPDIHLKEGSTMNLTCIITDSPEPPSYIFWRHDDAVSHFSLQKNPPLFLFIYIFSKYSLHPETFKVERAVFGMKPNLNK